MDGAVGYGTDGTGNGLCVMRDFALERVDDAVQVHLRLSGDLDLYNAPALDDALVAVEGEKWPTIVLDLRELEFLDSMALRLIMRTQARAQQDGRRLVIVRGPEFLDRVLTLSGLTEHLELVDEPPVPETTA
jgi:anti-anti-sigma factor